MTVPLEEQDRSRYDRARLAEASGLLDRALALARPGPLWGCYDVEAPHLDAVIDMVDGLWELDHGTVEIRPVFPAPEGMTAAVGRSP